MSPLENSVDLIDALLLLSNRDEAMNFLKDLCTPQEIVSFQERWRVCQFLHAGEFSYREISRLTGASPTTIGRVARFLKNEPYGGYKTVLNKVQPKDAQ